MSKVPEAFYNCTSKGCRGEVTYPAAMLCWWDGKAIEPDPTDPEDTGELPAAVRKDAGWYCDYCVEHFAARTSQNLQLLIESGEIAAFQRLEAVNRTLDEVQRQLAELKLRERDR